MAAAEFSLSDFRSQFPELDDKTDAEINRAAGVAVALASNSDLELLYCTAHIAVLDAERQSTPDGGSGEVMSESTMGARSVAYRTQASNGRETFYSTTLYGRTLLMLVKANPASALPRVYR